MRYHDGYPAGFTHLLTYILGYPDGAVKNDVVTGDEMKAGDDLSATTYNKPRHTHTRQQDFYTSAVSNYTQRAQAACAWLNQ